MRFFAMTLLFALIAAASPAHAACNYIQCLGSCGQPGGFGAGGCGSRQAYCWAQCYRGALRTYGAIAYSPTSHSYGYAYRYASRAQAEAHARSECGKRDCVIATWYYNQCGALATSPNGAWAGRHAARIRRAQALAEAGCAKEGGNKCTVLVSHCSR